MSKKQVILFGCACAVLIVLAVFVMRGNEEDFEFAYEGEVEQLFYDNEGGVTGLLLVTDDGTPIIVDFSDETRIISALGKMKARALEGRVAVSGESEGHYTPVRVLARVVFSHRGE